MANLDLPKKGSSTKWSLEDDNDEDDLDNTNGKSNEQQESEDISVFFSACHRQKPLHLGKASEKCN